MSIDELEKITGIDFFVNLPAKVGEQQAAKLNGFTANYFSFNADGGRCPECQGEGVVRIEMQFMADITLTCEACDGKRFKDEVLEVKYREKSVSDILDMSVDEAISRLEGIRCGFKSTSCPDQLATALKENAL